MVHRPPAVERQLTFSDRPEMQSSYWLCASWMQPRNPPHGPRRHGSAVQQSLESVQSRQAGSGGAAIAEAETRSNPTSDTTQVRIRTESAG